MDSFERNIFLLLVICIANSDCLSDTLKHNRTQNNYLIVDNLSDNEKESRIRWKNLSGKETTLDMDEERYANRWIVYKD